MGVKGIMNILKKTDQILQTVDLKELSGKIIALDMSLLSYQVVLGIGKHSDAPYIETLLFGLLCKINKFLQHNILCVGVFDGKPSSLKDNTIIAREAARSEDSFSLKHEDTELVKEMLDTIGIPYIQSSEESDPVLAYLQMNGYVDYVLSDDTDLMMYGCTAILRNQKGNSVSILHVQKFLTEHSLEYTDLVRLGVLLGNDYNSNPNKVGPVKALDSVLNKLTFEEVFLKYKVNDDKLLELMNTVFNYYCNEVQRIEVQQISQTVAKEEEIEIFLKTKLPKLTESVLKKTIKLCCCHNYEQLIYRKNEIAIISEPSKSFNKLTVALIKRLNESRRVVYV